ncbi:hypothetical protein QZH41_015680 [Actinostola sp. cb2023]|nr:hypothetical protein QZH41_015680 [Actinostola sp. cb2023]
MLSNKRRSAFSVYLENSARGAENDEIIANGGVSDPDQDTPFVTKKMKKMTPKDKSTKRGTLDKNAANGSTEQMETKSRRSILSKANKLRRSLHMSGKKKKRGRSMAGASEMEKVAVMDKDDSEPETAVPVQKKPRSDRSNTSIAARVNTRSNTSINTSISSSTSANKRPVCTYSMGSTSSLADGAMQCETEADNLIKWLLSPVKPKKFFSELWGRKPLLIKRHQPTYNKGWFSTSELDDIMRKHNVRFSVNLDVTSYKDGKRETHNPEGRAYAPVVWDFYQNDCSVRMLNPQSFSPTVWKLTSLLQEYFGCFVGANVYLTPAGTQGFAPHYDDIEAFIVQLEGKKHWRLYNPRLQPIMFKYSDQGNFSQDEIGEPILDTVLEAGDMLYFPRGTIHQGDTPKDSHSLHITLSTYQRNTWGDFLEKLVPRALQIAFQEDPEFRQGLPLNYLNCTGVANTDNITKDRSEFLRKIEKLMSKLIAHAPVDEAADQMAVSVISDCLPPMLTNRLINDDEGVSVYHTMENSRVYHEVEPRKLDFTSEAGPAIECIFNAFPDFIKVGHLPHDNMEFKVDVVTMLYEKGILVTKDPLEPLTS